MERDRHVVDVSVGALSNHYESLSIEVSKLTSADEIISCIADKLKLANISNYELAEVVSNPAGQECKERRLMPNEKPAALQMLWPQNGQTNGEEYQCKFYLRERLTDSFWSDSLVTDSQIIKDYFYKFLYQPKDKEYPDLCLLPNLNEGTLLENLKERFDSGHIYTYVGSILIAVNPFKFYPIYNPKYVKLYQNKRLGELPPHIFAIADSAYHTMLKERKNQCVVISGESGSGKTESTNFLLHHLTALSQKGSHGSGVEQTILSAGPVLEAFGNAKTAHNNNSSRFGKFIQVNYKENGLVQGAVVQKYLLEKSRICSQSLNERSYHVFYYLLSGATDVEKKEMHLLDPKDYKYLSQSKCYHIDGVDESYEYKRLKQSMELVGFSYETQKKVFCVLSAILLLGNIEYQQKKTAYHHDESVLVKNTELLNVISKLLKVKEDTLASALTTKKARTGGEILVINYRLAEAMAARDTLAKCLYGALFDWIVLQVNHALLSKKDLCKDSAGFSIGVLDIFGFEDFGNCNSFEQFCINFANERLQNYFNQHVFKYEQEEYQREGIKWNNIYFVDNSACLSMIEARPTGLLCILDDQCALPSATNETLLQKFHSVHKNSEYYAAPQRKENSFTIHHYAGKVKYQINEFREKNLDLMRGDIVNVLKNSSQPFVRELVSSDPVAGFRWAILRAFFQSYFAFIQAGKRHHQANGGSLRGYRKSLTPLRHAHSDILKKNKSNKLKRNPRYVVKNLQTVKVLAGKSSQSCVMPAISTSSNTNTGRGTRKQPHTVTAQFQSSLLSLLVTLNRATPFFIRCIKSNAHKSAGVFDDEIIQRQLRYTGMLETVRIRQAGFSVRMTFETFTQHYRILLPKGLQSTPHDIKMFLLSVNLNRDNYQVGETKIFMRESEKLKLDYRLHQAIISRIVTIQRWFRCVSQRRHFMRLRSAVIRIQAEVRCFLAQRALDTLRLQHCAATFIQKCWRGYRIRKWYQNMRSSVLTFQAYARGHLVRTRVKEMSEKCRMTPSTDEAFLSKESSQEELESDITAIAESPRDSEGSSGVHEEDSENEWTTAILKKYSHNGHSTECPTEPGRPPILHRSQSTKVPSLLKNVPTSDKSYTTVEDITLSSLRSEAGDLHGSDDKGLHSQSRFQKAKKQLKMIMGGKKTKPELSGSDTSLYAGHPQHNSHSYRDVPKSVLTQSLSSTSISSGISTPPQVPERKFSQPIQSSWSKNVPPIQMDSELLRQSSEPPGHAGYNFLQPVLNTSSVNLTCEHPTNLYKEPSLSSRMDSWESTTAHDHQRHWTDKHQTISFPPPSSPSASEASDSLYPLKSFISMTPDTAVRWEDDRRSESYSGSFPLSRHNLVKTTKFYRGEMCIICKKMMTSFFTHGFRCNSCHNCFHPKCDPSQIICDKELSNPRRKRKSDKSSKKWNLNRTSEFTDREDQIIADVTELRALDDFLSIKIFSMNDKKETSVDKDFKSGLREFKANLIQTYSVVSKNTLDTQTLNIRYRDLITSFEQVMGSVCEHGPTKDMTAVTMAVNAFRGFLNEFVQLRMDDHRPRVKKSKRERKKRRDEVVLHLNHQFVLVILNIPTACEICSSFLWLMEKGLVCKNCKLTCHKKCYTKVSVDCSKDDIKENISPDSSGAKLFGARLESLVKDGDKIPPIVERLIVTIEMNGLYTEGLYRKSGATSAVKQLIHKLEEDADSVDFESYTVHVLTAVLKTFLREMPEPLMTFEAYDDFLRATDVQDDEERTSAIFSVIRKLPITYFNLLERLMFHLARVAYHDDYNRMTPSSLAIVFAPCILKTNKIVKVQDTLNDIRRITLCVQAIIQEQCVKLKSTLADIDTLDSACHTVTTRLTSLPIDSSKRESDCEATILSQQIEDIKQEKAHLTSVLPVLRRINSDDDLLSTDMDSASNVGSLDDFPSLDEISNSIVPLSKATVMDTPMPDTPPFRRSTAKIRQRKSNSSPAHSSDNTIVSIYQPYELECKDDAVMV